MTDQLNYKINQVAKSLKTNKTYTIALIVSDISNPFSAGLARIIENESEKYNYTTIFGSSDEDVHKFEKLINTFINRKVDGLIISPPANAEHLVINLQQQRIPFVLLDRYFPGIKTSYIALDNFTASFDAVQHLVDTGRKRIGMITYQSDLFHLEERKRGYTAALKKNNIKLEKSWLKQVDITNNKTAIEEAVNALLSINSSIDGVLFGSNTIAMHSLKYINTLPLKIPQDLAIASFDQAAILDIFYPPVTYIKQPLEEIGKLAIKALLENMKDATIITETKLKAELIIQQSSAGIKI